MSKTATLIDRKNSYINHLSHIEGNNTAKSRDKSIQYFSYDHCVAWTFAKGKKCELSPF